MTVLKVNFGAKANKTQVHASTQGLEEWTEQNRRAFGYLSQIYGALIAAGVYTDYELVADPGMVGMNLRPRGAADNAPRKWMSFEHDHKQKLWVFRYRSIAMALPDLDTLAQRAHGKIAQLEKRDLPPLMPVINKARIPVRALRS